MTSIKCPSYLDCRLHTTRIADYQLKLGRATFALQAIAGYVTNYQIENLEAYAIKFLKENDLKPEPVMFSFMYDDKDNEEE